MVNFKENELRAGQAVLDEAKRDRASRRKSVNSDISAATYEGLNFYDRAPVSLVMSRWEGRQKPAICYICGTRGGSMYVENGNKFCIEHKYLMRAPIEEIERAKKQIKERLNVKK